MKKRSFAFALAYIKFFRTYSVYLSLRLPAQILYAGIHLPPQREARALPRRAQIFPPCFRQWGDTYPFSFVTKKKSGKTVKEKFRPLRLASRFFTSAIKALVCPFAVLRSRFGLRYSRVRGRRQSKSLASSSTGGARNFYPKGGINAPPQARCFPTPTAVPDGVPGGFQYT